MGFVERSGVGLNALLGRWYDKLNVSADGLQRMAHWLDKSGILQWQVCLGAGKNCLDETLCLHVTNGRRLAEHCNQDVASEREIFRPGLRFIPRCYS